MLRTQFEEELLNLHNQFYEMGMMVSSAVHKSVRAYIKHDKILAQEVIENDININNMETRLEKKSFEMIALQQPVTTDLRMIITVMKASSDLERMADHAVSVAKSTIRVKGQTRIPEIERDLRYVRLCEKNGGQRPSCLCQNRRKRRTYDRQYGSKSQ
ncbi:phosphate signaling complex protein PhoU [Enterococcus faecium]